MPLPSLASESSDIRVTVTGVLTSPVAGGTVTIDLTTGARVYKWTAGEDETVNASGKQLAGMRVVCVITSDASIRTITFGTGFKATATFATTASKTGTVSFISDGTSLWETGRSEAIT